MLNSFADLCKEYSAYKLDDIYNMKYSLYYVLMRKYTIENKVKAKLSESKLNEQN